MEKIWIEMYQAAKAVQKDRKISDYVDAGGVDAAIWIMAVIRKIGACKTMGSSQINGADAVIVTMVKTANQRQAEFWIEDGAIASAYLLLAIEQYGLGACWVHIRNRMGIYYILFHLKPHLSG